MITFTFTILKRKSDFRMCWTHSAVTLTKLLWCPICELCQTTAHTAQVNALR